MRLTSSHFVGRVGELGELELAAREAEGRSPTLVLLGGDSGVGKTRLLDELERRLQSDEMLVLRGAAVEEGDAELPYSPLLNALRPLVRERDPVLATLAQSSRAQLAKLLPGLEPVPAPEQAPDGSGQVRLFEALLDLLHALSERQPLALILEDVHWADSSTRTFVSFLARSLRREHLVVVLSFRTDELHRRHPLRALLAELERLGRARRIELAPFDRAELTEALTDILGDAPPEELVTRLYERSEGNPLYTEELLAAGLDGRGAAPASLRDAFLLRAFRLSPPAQRAARAIAAGRLLDQAMIAEVTGIDGDALTVALREAVDAQVLVSVDDGRLAFRHALLREAVVDDLLPGERGELHLALARAFERAQATASVDVTERAAAIAFHYAAAGDQPAALRATFDAALAACRVHAYAEMAELCDRALELWPRVEDPAALIEHDHIRLLALASDAHSLSGDRPRGELLLARALEELDPRVDPERYAALLARLARLEWALGRGEEGLATAQRALAMLPEHADGSARTLLLAWLARTLVLRGRYRDAVRDGEQAIAAARAAGDREAEAELMNTLGMAYAAHGRVDEGVALLREAIEHARAIDDRDGMSYAYANLAEVLHVHARSAEALAVAQEGVAAAPARSSSDWLRLSVFQIAFDLGDWAAARAALDAVPPQLDGVLALFRAVCEADLALGEGRDEPARRALDDVAGLVASSSEPQWIGPFGTLRAELRRRERDLPGARAAVAQALDRLELCTEDVIRIARVTAAGLRVEADFAQRARDLRDKPAEREALQRARIHLERLRAAAADGGPIERAWAAAGSAELARARGRNDADAWCSAANAWEAVGRAYLAAIARWREAEALVERDDRAAAAVVARTALAAAHRLGSGWLTSELTSLCDRARLSLAHEPDGEPQRVVEEDPFGLTARERQVLTLLAEGATNRQIGAALFMAEKTASVHVSRILSKLGVHSRTQAAAVAHRLELT
ncbi:MAG: AAA family ATPase [Solirubrobacteraceae bacterium]|jgi:DNA-binding CsgD family transcriptional regulator